MGFPASPSNNDLYELNNKIYKYVSSDNRWYQINPKDELSSYVTYDFREKSLSGVARWFVDNIKSAGETGLFYDYGSSQTAISMYANIEILEDGDIMSIGSPSSFTLAAGVTADVCAIFG
jgi:hypothetical protein